MDTDAEEEEARAAGGGMASRVEGKMLEEDG